MVHVSMSYNTHCFLVTTLSRFSAPQSAVITTIENRFCNGNLILPDGRLIFVGGDVAVPPNIDGWVYGSVRVAYGGRQCTAAWGVRRQGRCDYAPRPRTAANE